MPAASFRSAAQTTQTSTSSLVVNKPAGVVAGDLLLALIHSLGLGTTMGTPSGWTKITNILDAGALTGALYSKVAGGSEPSSYTFTSDSIIMGGAIAAYQNVGASPIDASSTAVDSDGTTTCTSPSVTSTGADRVIARMLCGMSGGTSTFSTPAGHTERYDASGSGLEEISQPAAGASGTVSVTVTSGRTIIMATLAIAGLDPPPARPQAPMNVAVQRAAVI